MSGLGLRAPGHGAARRGAGSASRSRSGADHALPRPRPPRDRRLSVLRADPAGGATDRAGTGCCRCEAAGPRRRFPRVTATLATGKKTSWMRTRSMWRLCRGRVGVASARSGRPTAAKRPRSAARAPGHRAMALRRGRGIRAVRGMKPRLAEPPPPRWCGVRPCSGVGWTGSQRQAPLGNLRRESTGAARQMLHSARIAVSDPPPDDRSRRTARGADRPRCRGRESRRAAWGTGLPSPEVAMLVDNQPPQRRPASPLTQRSAAARGGLSPGPHSPPFAARRCAKPSRAAQGDPGAAGGCSGRRSRRDEARW